MLRQCARIRDVSFATGIDKNCILRNVSFLKGENHSCYSGISHTNGDPQQKSV